MDELLNKNIFADCELLKLSPDYKPTNVLLRIQTRSTMVKDTHTHKFKDDGLPRKTIKRSKECYKFSREIVNIRNTFENMNLKNQIMLKNAVKYVDTLGTVDFVTGDEEECDVLGHEAETYLRDISEMNLAVESDSEFKLNAKPKIQRVKKIFKNNTQSDHKNIETPKTENCHEEEELYIESMLRVECTKLQFPKMPSEEYKEQNVSFETNIINTKESVYLSETSESQNGVDKDVNDLQTLLVMLAISPKTNEHECDSSDGPISNHRSLTNEMTVVDIGNVNQLPTEIAKSKDSYEFLNVTPMRIEINDRQKVIMKKCVEKWREYVIKKKDLLLKQREETLNSFFDKLSRKKTSMCDTPETPANKAKLLANDCSRYRHRYQMQKHIIALQKAKLEEQSRIIEELKYNRIIEASKLSVDAMREEVRKTYYEMDKQLKPKMKCLTNELNIEIEEPSLVLHCLKVPQFLQRMEKRAREREEKHAIIRERRKQLEEERTRLKQQEELARTQMDKEEKLKRMKELKDKRKREKIDNIRKQQYSERMRALTVMADLHYEKVLKARYGIRPLRILMAIKQDNIEKSKAHYKFQLKKNVFLNWMFLTEDMWYERNYKAEDFYRKKVLRKALNALKKNHHSYVLKRQVAEDYYDLFVTNLVFKKFCEAIVIVKKEHEIRWQKAVLYYNSNLCFRAFSCWRTLPALNALQREQEARKARWREKVLQVVPDYTPPDD